MIPILAKIHNAINPCEGHYLNEKDYYGSPVSTVFSIETGPDPEKDCWPFVRKEFLDIKEFPHDLKINNARNRDMPVVFLYQIAKLLVKKKVEEPLTDEDIKDQNLKNAFGRHFTQISIARGIKEVRKIFLESYNYLLSKLLIDQGVSIDYLLSSFQLLFSSFDDEKKKSGPKWEQYEFYIRHSFIKYMDFAKKCFSYPYILNRDIIKRIYSRRNADWNKNIKFYGPEFLMRAVSMQFLYNDIGKEDNYVLNPLVLKDVEKPGISFDQWGESHTFNLNERHTSIAQDIAYCLAAEVIAKF